MLLPALGAAETVRGRLDVEPGHAPVLLLEGQRAVELRGDEDTLQVLADARLKDFEFEAEGHYMAPGRFEIDPIHTSALFVRRAGSRLAISYRCEVCGIRQATPGRCRCCQEEMAFDPRDPALKDSDH